MGTNSLLTILISAGVGGAVAFIGNLLLHGRTRWLETRTYATGLVREIILLTRKLDAYRAELMDFHSNRVGTVPAWPLTDDDVLIYRFNTAKIGLLDHRIAFTTIKVYQQVRDLGRVAETKWNRAQAEWIDKEAHLPSGPWLEKLRTHIEQVDAVSDKAKEVYTILEGWSQQSYWQRIRPRIARSPQGQREI